MIELLQLQHQQNVQCVELAADGKLVAVASRPFGQIHLIWLELDQVIDRKVVNLQSTATSDSNQNPKVTAMNICGTKNNWLFVTYSPADPLITQQDRDEVKMVLVIKQYDLNQNLNVISTRHVTEILPQSQLDVQKQGLTQIIMHPSLQFFATLSSRRVDVFDMRHRYAMQTYHAKDTSQQSQFSLSTVTYGKMSFSHDGVYLACCANSRSSVSSLQPSSHISDKDHGIIMIYSLQAGALLYTIDLDKHMTAFQMDNKVGKVFDLSYHPLEMWLIVMTDSGMVLVFDVANVLECKLLFSHKFICLESSQTVLGLVSDNTDGLVVAAFSDCFYVMDFYQKQDEVVICQQSLEKSNTFYQQFSGIAVDNRKLVVSCSDGKTCLLHSGNLIRPQALKTFNLPLNVCKLKPEAVKSEQQSRQDYNKSQKSAKVPSARGQQSVANKLNGNAGQLRQQLNDENHASNVAVRNLERIDDKFYGLCGDHVLGFQLPRFQLDGQCQSVASHFEMRLKCLKQLHRKWKATDCVPFLLQLTSMIIEQSMGAQPHFEMTIDSITDIPCFSLGLINDGMAVCSQNKQLLTLEAATLLLPLCSTMISQRKFENFVQTGADFALLILNCYGPMFQLVHMNPNGHSNSGPVDVAADERSLRVDQCRKHCKKLLQQMDKVMKQCLHKSTASLLSDLKFNLVKYN